MRTAPALLFLLLALTGCGGDEGGDPNRDTGSFVLSSTSTDYNGYFADFDGDLTREIGNEDMTITVTSGFRRFRIVLGDDVLKKGQIFDLDDPDEARATYDEGSDKAWVALGGRAEVTDELLGNFTVRLRDLKFDRADDEENQALGRFNLDGRLYRR